MIVYRPFAFVGMALALLSAPSNAGEQAPVAIWVEQHARSADHAFIMQLTVFDEFHAAQAIKVIDRKSGAMVQTIDAIDGLEVQLEPARFLRIDDANADGHPDISVLVNNGGAGPNSVRNFYLFNPATRQFVFHEGLSELSQVTVHPNGTITSAGRGGGQHTASTYRFIRAKMVEVKRVDHTWSTDGRHVIVKTGTLRGEKMRFTSQRLRAVMDK